MKLRQIMLTSLVGIGMLTSVLANAGSNTSYEIELIRAINQYRQTKNLPPLQLSNTLNQLASEHSTYMYRRNQLNHDHFKQRFQRSGRNGCVENVGWNYQTGDKQFRGWYKSPGHYKNMIDPNITFAGVARSGAYTTFFACR